MSAADGGDTITYTVTVENIGGAPAYDVVITDPAVTELSACSIVSVADGNGTPIPYRDPADVNAPASPGLPIPTDLSNGIKLDIPLAGNDDDPADGGAPYVEDTAIVTYNCTLAVAVEPTQQIDNTASVTWASQDGATNFPLTTDSATVTIVSPTIDKTVTAITPGYAGDLTEAQIGEVITYQVLVSVSEGTSQNVSFTDLLDNGLAFTDVVSITPSSGDVTTDVAGGFAGVLASAVFANQGGGTHQLDRTLTLDFGTVTNANTDDATAEAITIVYRARVLNWTNNNRGNSRNNSATWSWGNPNGGDPLSVSDSAPNVTIIEPELQVVKTLSAATADAGDTITVTLDISHTGSSNGDAFDVTLEDVLPAGLTFAGGFSTSGLAPDTGPAHAGGTVTASWNSIPDGSTAQVSFNVTVDGTIAPEETIQNSATIEWESLQTADQGALPPSPNNTLDVERTGDPADTGGAANDYTNTDSDSLTVSAATVSKTLDSIAPGGSAPNITAGDTVTYRLTVTLPEGTASGLTLSDALPAGLAFQNAVLDTTGFAGSVSLASAVPSGTVAVGQTVAITFGASTTVTADNNPANNSFAVLVTALVDGAEAANDGLPAVQNKTNAVTLDYIGNSGTIQDSVSVNFTEPELDLSKTMSPDTGLQAGDTVTITLDLENTGTGAAHDVVITDVLNDDGLLFDLSSVAEGTTAAGYTYNFDGTTVTYTGSGPLLAGASIQFTFTANVLANALTGSTYTNTASVAADSQSGVVSGERAVSDTGMDSVTTASATQAKSIIATSESWTSDTGTVVGAIGEVITYRLAITVPEGLTQADPATPIITDTLPAGFQYLTGTATIRAVADVAIITTGALPVIDSPITPDVNGQTLEFDLGNILNSDNDANDEQIIIEYDVLILNTSNNNRDDSKTNTGTFTYLNRAGNPQSITASQTLRIGEPSLALTKDATPTSVTGGTTVTFTVVLSNETLTRTTRAWEMLITDTLPVRYDPPLLDSATLSRGAVDLSACVNVVGQTITLDTDDACLAAAERYLDPGETITLVYTADVVPDILFEEQVTNTADAQATSLPGDNGTGAATPGAPDSDTGERTGSGNTNTSGQNVNDLTVMDSATVIANRPTVSKVGDANLQIGETSTFTVTVSVPPGSTNSFVLTDDLPTGLRYTGIATITPPATNFTASNTPTVPAADTDPLVFDFGDVSNTAAVSQNITISYEVQVENVLANQDLTNLENNAQLSYQGIGTPISDTATITVVEPNLDISKTITAGAANSDAGDTISYQVVVSNTNANATAYRVDLRDVLPATLLGAPDGTGTAPFFLNITVDNDGGAVVKNAGGALVAAEAQFTTTTETDDTLTWPLFDLPPSSTLTITYDAVVTNDAPAGATLVNNVTATYHSLADGAAAGRDGSSAGSDDDNDADLDNYNESDSASLTLNASISIQKTLSAGQPDSNFTIGDEVLYDLRVDLSEGVTSDVVIVDILPTGLSFIELVTIEADPNISFDGPGTALEAPPGLISIDLGTVDNIADNNSSNDFLIARIRAQVLDIPGNSQGTTRTNGASVASALSSAGPDTQDITIVEPNLIISKVPSDTTPTLGDVVTFTVTVRHDASGADAFDVILTDAIPAGLSYVPGSTTGQATVNETDPSTPVFDLGTITLAEIQKTFSFQATVDLDATVGQAIDNVIVGSYSTQPGEPTIERDYSGNGTGTVTPDVDAFIDAVKLSC
ncbi:MAG: isopeptide-forming domain-containing fimbrial protein [Gammaproteobacteria bacterium]